MEKLKHRDLIDIRGDYRPVFTLGLEDSERNWKLFIPHQNFFEFLNKVLDLVEGRSKKTSLWLQGSYGVGKSHACSVIAHLLFDSWEDIRDYVEREFYSSQIAARIKTLRQNHKFIPVYLIGTGDVPSLEYLSFYVKSHIKKNLELLNLNPPLLKTEVDVLINLVEKEDENQILREIPEYETKEALIRDLKKIPPDNVALKKTYEYFAEKGIYVYKSFEEWIKRVVDLVKEQNYSGILLIWDEFTQILDTGFVYIEKLQNLLAENPDLYLIVVSHRMADFYKNRVSEETYRKVSDRFVHHKLELSEITVFHILKRALVKKDYHKWEEVANSKFLEMSSFIEKITYFFEGQKPKVEDIKELYPLHPYTVLIATHVAEKFFSSGRSIFGFLFDERGALKDFLEKDVESEPFLTVDSLWDYFFEQLKDQDYGDFARDIINYYFNYEEKVKALGSDYLKVFKILLILNLLYKSADFPLIHMHPTKENTILAYAGTPLMRNIEKILERIHTEGILPRSPDEKFLVLSSSLPQEELKNEEWKLKGKYSRVSKIMQEFALRDYLLKDFEKDELRKRELIIVFPDESYKHKLSSGWTLQIVLGFYQTQAEREKYREIFKKGSEERKDAVFIIWDEEFGEDKLSEWIRWKAREIVAQNHNFYKEANESKRRADLVLKKFLNRDIYCLVYFRGEEKKIAKRDISSYFRECSEKIYTEGPESLDIRNSNLWTKSGKDLISKILTAERLKEVEEVLSKGPQKELNGALYDRYKTKIFIEDLSINPKADPSYPIVSLSRKLEELFKGKPKFKSEDFNFLRRPPYGIYDNKVSAFMLACALKPLQKRIYKLGIGRASIQDLQEFCRGILEGKRTNIELRFGSEAEDRLADLLRDIFVNLVKFREEDKYLIRVRNTIREEIMNVGFPLWSLAHLDEETLKNYSPDIEALRNIFRDLSKFIGSSDTEFKEEKLQKLYIVLDPLKMSLKQVITKENILKGKRLFIERKIGSRNLNIEEIIRKVEENLSSNANFWDEAQVSSVVDSLIQKMEKERLLAIKKSEEDINKITLKDDDSSSKFFEGKLSDIDRPDDTKREDLLLIIRSIPHSDLIELTNEVIKKFSEVRIFIMELLKQKGYV